MFAKDVKMAFELVPYCIDESMNDLEDAYFIIETLIEVANRLNQ